MLSKAVIARLMTWACLASVATLLVGAAAIVLAEFGGPVWAFVVLGVWMWTVGLPTTLAVLLLTSVWGNIPWVPTGSLGAFFVCAAVLAFTFQIVVFRWITKVLKSMAGRQT